MNWHYFITITPPERTYAYSKLKFKNPQYCVYLDDKLIIENAFKSSKIKRYILFPEISDTGRLHYHGKIILSDSQRVSLFKSVKPKLEGRIGFVDVQPVKDDLECLNYCRKNWYTTKTILDIDQPITPQLSKHNRGRKEGFKSPRDLLDLDTNPITNYLEI